MSNMKASQLTGSETDIYFEPKTWDNTVELTAYLMQLYNIDINHVIRHYDVYGKIEQKKDSSGKIVSVRNDSYSKQCPRPMI